MRFDNRQAAGRLLGIALGDYAQQAPIVLALPRGGVPVAFEVAHALGAPLDVLVVRKLGAPMQPELAVGAVGEEGAVYINRELCATLGITDGELTLLKQREQAEVNRRVQLYRAGRPLSRLHGRTVILVDDGVATGASAQVAIRVLRMLGAERVIFAVPVAAAQAVAALEADADEVVALEVPGNLVAIGLWYRDFRQVHDSEVEDCLMSSRAGESDCLITTSKVRLRGTLAVPPHPVGLVLFAHGTGSSHHSPRNRYVASVFQSIGLATLLIDLHSDAAPATRGRTLDGDLEPLAQRLAQAADWTRHQPRLAHLPLGYFGGSTGAAVALMAAAAHPSAVRAVVARGGRPDLAWEALGLVQAPTLLLVGEQDREVLAVNRRALSQLRCQKELAVIPEATHLFKEPGALEAVARQATLWFVRFLPERTANREAPEPI